MPCGQQFPEKRERFALAEHKQRLEQSGPQEFPKLKVGADLIEKPHEAFGRVCLGVDSAVFQLWSLFADADAKAAMFARAKAGGLGYGEVKKDLLQRLLAYFEPMRERRAELEKRPDYVEDVLKEGARRARELANPTLSAARQAAGLGIPQ